MGGRNTPSSPCPTSRHQYIELLQTFPLDFLLRTALHCGSKQPFQYLALNLLCILLLLFSALPSAFFYSFYLFDTLFFDTPSPISTVLSLIDFYVFFFFFFNSFYASFPQEKGDIPHQPNSSHTKVSWRSGKKHCSCLAMQGED